jgi:hypothetical protein
MKDLRIEVENIVREYKILRLSEREKGRRNKTDNENVLILNEIVNKLESVLGYSVSMESNVCSSSIEDRLKAIGEEN